MHYNVSTHSRPKAAGERLTSFGSALSLFQLTAARRRLAQRRGDGGKQRCFNSQPPEGGWPKAAEAMKQALAFQLTAARRRLANYASSLYGVWYVSTHSRPKAAGILAV